MVESSGIKEILDSIRLESSDKKKLAIIKSHSNNKLLERVLYLAYSKRVKFYIKKIPDYVKTVRFTDENTLEYNLFGLDDLMDRSITGNEAIQHLKFLLEASHPDDAHVIERIIDKDLRMGVAATTINKAFPDLIEKTPYMGAQSFKKELVEGILEKNYGYSQVKMDGRYCNAIIDSTGVRLESRSGEPTVIIGAKLLTELERWPLYDDEDGVVLNGELTIDGVDRNTSNGIINSVISISKKLQSEEDATKDMEHIQKRHDMTYEQALDRIKYTVWDLITLEAYNERKMNVRYAQRLTNLALAIEDMNMESVALVETEIVHTFEEAMDHFKKMLNLGLEGTILKGSQDFWKDGKPKWQVKMKLEIDIDMEIIGFNYGKEGTKNEHVISSLTVKTSDGKIITKPGGIDEDTMDYITENQEELMGRIIEMKCCGVSHDNMGNYSTLHPVFKRIRDDKTVANSFDEVMDIENAAKSLA